MPHRHIIVTGEAGHGKDTIGLHLVEQYGYRRLGFADSLRDEMVEAYAGAPEPVTIEFMGIREIKNLPQHRLALRFCSDKDFVGVALEAFAQEDEAFWRECLERASSFSDGLDTPDNWRSAMGEVRARLLPSIPDLDWNKALAPHRTGFTDEERELLPRSYRRIAQVWGTEYRRRSEFGYDSYWLDQVDAIMRSSTIPLVITDGRFPNELDWAESVGMQRIHTYRPGYGETKIVHDSEKIPPPTPTTIVISNDRDLISLLTKVDQQMAMLVRADDALDADVPERILPQAAGASLRRAP
jgi:hypothetical protein